MKKLLNYLLIGLVSTFIISSCVDNKFDEPEFPFEDPAINTNTTIAGIKALHSSGGFETIADDLVFSAIVIANDSTGNFYKKIVVQDETGGLEILIDGRNLYGKYPVGRKVFVKAKNLVVGDDYGIVQLGALLSDGALVSIPFQQVGDIVVGGSLNNPITAKELSFSQITDNDLSTLVKFNDVEFSSSELGKTFADGTAHVDKNKKLEDCSKKEFIIRTSGYAEFANDTLPSLKGTLMCIVGKYRSDYQGYLRSLNDINFDQERCSGGASAFSDDFEAGIDKWNAVNVLGDQVWTHSSQHGNPGGCAKMTGYSGGSSNANEDWLITPQIDFSGISNPSLIFDNATKYNGNAMEVYISTDYSGSGDPNSASWTKLDYVQSGGNWAWTSSGKIDLSSYADQKVFIGFKYTSTDSATATWEIDNVVVK